MRFFVRYFLIVLSLCAFSHTASAAVIEFTVKSAWQLAAGDVTTIPFTGFPGSTIITDQYEGQGVLFTDSNDEILNAGVKFFPNDGSGLAPNHSSSDPDGDINLLFATNQFNLGVDYPGAIRIQLYRENQLIYTSSNFGGSGAGLFAGLISTDPFDSAVLIDWNDDVVFIDDLHFGIPGSGAIPLIALAALWPRYRRRR